jgi:hypothetical protein
VAHLYRGIPPVPFKDVEWPEHDEGESCWCKPKIEPDAEEPGRLMIVHRCLSEIRQLKMEN